MELMARLMPPPVNGNNPVGITGNYMDLENQRKIAEAIRLEIF